MRPLLIALTGIMAMVGLITASSCLVNRKSDELSCSTAEDCGPLHDCTEGFCVAVDAPNCFTNCTDLGGTCSGDTCILTDPASVTCPAGLRCQIECNATGSCGTINCSQSSCNIHCNGAGSCPQGVTCTGGACQVSCVGDGSCADTIQCGSSACNVACTGPDSCAQGTSCANSCNCIVQCSGSGSCASAASCPSPASQCDDGQGCKSSPNACHSC